MNKTVWLLEEPGKAPLVFDTKAVMERHIKVSRRDLSGKVQKAVDVWVYGGKATGSRVKIHTSSDLSI
jgi:hypothetical protein